MTKGQKKFFEVRVGTRGCRVWHIDGALQEIELVSGKGSKLNAVPGPLRKLAGELKTYLAGKGRRISFRAPIIGSPFHRQVYKALVRVQYGKVLSYGELAAMAGRPGAARAVGTAMARNRFPLLIPCHRVVAAGGKLGGYGSGIGWKKFLLDLEKANK
jgi:methylated-DNA-[protein]-cysteine S-methyltransferase